jgi:hypothetical protein
MRDMVKQCRFSYNGFLHNKIMSLCDLQPQRSAIFRDAVLNLFEA